MAVDNFERVVIRKNSGGQLKENSLAISSGICGIVATESRNYRSDVGRPVPRAKSAKESMQSESVTYSDFPVTIVALKMLRSNLAFTSDAISSSVRSSYSSKINSLPSSTSS